MTPRIVVICILAIAASVSRSASADAPTPSPASTAALSPPPPALGASTDVAASVSGTSSSSSSTPSWWRPRALETGQHFAVDPVTDGVLIGGGAAISGLLGLILSTGEIKAELPGPTSNLLPIDRPTVNQHVDPHAGLYSNVTLYAAIGFAALDPFLSAKRDGWDAALVDAVMYAETLSLTETLTSATKIAVRRPRPIDYENCPATATATTATSCTGNTDLALSFFSGHSSTVAAIGATATYLAFQRSGANTPRPWITLVTSVAMTTFVSVERVRAGEHFPTDVIAGSIAGAMVGVLVPHLHRHVQEAPPIWIGFAPAPGGGSATVGATF